MKIDEIVRLNESQGTDKINICDLVILEHPTGDLVSGFVTKITKDDVKLSHEHPKNGNIYATNHPFTLSLGDRIYPKFKFWDTYYVVRFKSKE